ncbi:hypothetical protein CULT_30101 [[Clostridium] ultunense Esp]|nr:hypothetical protein CULT_30101 [[Clostridium] ultunense Esp]
MNIFFSILKDIDQVLDQLALTIDQETAKKLLESGKGLTVKNNGADIQIPAASLSAFVGADGTFTLTTKVEKAKEGAGVTIQAASAATVVSPILTIGEPGTALKEPLVLTLKLKDEAAKDARKVGPYSRTTSGAWSYVGNLKDRQANAFTVKTSTLGTFALIEYAKSFDDIANHWAKDAVEVMASQNIVKGSSANTFNPEGKVTRAEFATMLVRALGLSAKGAYTGQFTDVKESDWFAGSVEAAAKAGIIRGSGGKFNPKASVTREEMTVMLIRALGLTDQAAGLTPSFSDAGSVATWAKEAVALAQQKGLISGIGNNLFAPKGISKRAEAATLLFRLMDAFRK